MATQLGALKRIRGFQGFNVDGFNYQGPDIVAYFLTHFHSDHTCGLHAGFKGPAPIYCSPVTGALLTAVMGVKSSMVRPMPLGVPFDVPTGDGEVAVATFIDANHCPGSVLVHLRHKATGRIVLHTGDFRAARCVREDQTLHALIDTHGKIDELLLDTTYCAPQWKFPDQDQVCAAMGEIVRRELAREPRTLFLVGSYSIGKERAVAAVTRAANSRAGVGWHRARTLKLSGWWDDAMYVCEDDEYAMQSATDAAQRVNIKQETSLTNAVHSVSGAIGADALDVPDRPDGDRGSHGAISHREGLSHREPPTLVRVVPMGGGSLHDNMVRLLSDDVDPETGRPWYAAVCAFRPTGWSYTRSKVMPSKATLDPLDGGNPLGKVKGEPPVKEEAVGAVAVKPEPGEAAVVAVEANDVGGASSALAEAAAELAAAYKPWVENDGRTRSYSVPYSEHSSFVELVEFVKRIRPRRVTPTVNADTKADRDKIMKHFLEFTDLAADKNRLDHYFTNKRHAPEVKVEVKREIEAEPAAALPASDGSNNGGIDPEILAALGDVLTPEELRQQSALWAAAQTASRAAQEAAQAAVLGPFPLGCVALVRGGGGGFGGNGPRYVQFKDKSHVEQRLRALGATIVHRISPKVTHVVVPAGGEALAEEERRHGGKAGKGGGDEATDGSARKEGYEAPDTDDIDTDGIDTKGDLSKKGDPSKSTPPAVVTEGWVMRHWRAQKTGVAEAHDDDTVRAHQERVKEERRREAAERTVAAKRRREEADSGVEQRPGRERTMSRAVMDRVGRARAQRLFLVQRRDVSRGPAGVGGAASTGPGATPAGGEDKWHAVFAVFGTTGNVYECHVCANPSCTCPDFTGDLRTNSSSRKGGGHICKHLLWVYMRVLGVQRDDPVLCQVALLQSELAAMLAAPSRAQRASLATASVRDAYLAATGTTRGTEELAPAPVTRQPIMAQPPDNGDGDDADPVTCPVCFDPLEDPADAAAGSRETDLSAKVWWCRGGCGGNVHSACMRRWMAKSGMAPACPLCRATWVPQEDAEDAASGQPLGLPSGLPGPLALPTSPASTAGLPSGGAPFTSPGGSSYVNLRAYQGGTAAHRDLSQYNDFARKAIEKREKEERERREREGG